MHSRSVVSAAGACTNRLRRWRLRLAMALAGLALTLASVARAQTGPGEGARVTIISSARDTTAAARIAAELRAFGFACRVRVSEGAPDPAEGERAVRAGARAVVQLDGRAGKTQVLIPGSAVRTSVRATAVTPPSSSVLEGTAGTIDPVLIVRTVELVRASLLRPVGVAAPAVPSAATTVVPPPTATPAPPAAPAAPPPAPPAPPPATSPPLGSPALPAIAAAEPPAGPPREAATASTPPAPPARDEPPAATTPAATAVPARESLAVAPAPAPLPDRRRWRAGVSGGIAAAGGGLAPAPILRAHVSARVAGPFHAELLAVAPLSASLTTTGEGSSRSTAWLAGAGVTARTSAGTVSLEAGAGALAIWFRSTGTAAPSPAPLVGGSDSVVGAAAYGRMGAAVPLGRALAARLDLFAGETLLRPVIRFNTIEPAAWGPLFAVATAGLDLRW